MIKEASAMSDILLHGAAGSPFVRKVQIVLAEKGLGYEHVQTIPVADPPPGLPFPGITPELKPYSPLGKIPFARVGDRWLADSSVIIAYLDRLHPDPPIYPSDPWDYARALWFEELIDGGAYPKLFGTIFFERVLAPMLFNRPTDQAIVDKAIAEDLPTIYGYLDSEIGSQSFLVGEQFTIADASVASFFLSMQQADAAPDPMRWPNLARYAQAQYARPTIAGLIEREAAAMAASPTA
jgi:glutathione S-transferase